MRKMLSYDHVGKFTGNDNTGRIKCPVKADHNYLIFAYNQNSDATSTVLWIYNEMQEENISVQPIINGTLNLYVDDNAIIFTTPAESNGTIIDVFELGM